MPRLRGWTALAAAVCLIFWAGASRASALDLTPEERAFITAHPSVTYSDADQPPLAMVDKGRDSGMLRDYYQLVSKLTGIEFRFKPMGKGDLRSVLDALRDKRIDMVGGAARTAHRAEYALFAGPLFRFPLAIASRVGNLIGSMDDLRGRTVVVVADSPASRFMGESNPDMELISLARPDEALRLLATGKADAVLGDMPELAYGIHRMGLYNVRVSGLSGHVSDICSLVRKDMPLLASILDKAHAAIPQKARQDIYTAWLPVQASPGSRTVNLTAEEEGFLRDHQVFKMSNEKNWPPFNFNENGLPQGYSVDLMNLLARMAGFKVEYVTGPDWNELEAMLQNGTLDVMLNMAETQSRKAYAVFTEPYATLVHGLVFRDSEPEPPTLETLKGRTVAVPKGFFTEDVLRDNYPDIRLVTPPDTLGCLQAVSTGRADAAVGSLAPLNYLIRKHFLTNLQARALVDSRHFPTVNIRFGVRKDMPVLAAILDKTLAHVTGGQMEELRRKWLVTDARKQRYIQLTPPESAMLSRLGEVRMCVDPDWMPLSSINSQGEYVGMTADYMRIMAERIGVDVRLVPTETWSQTLDYAALGKCDIVQAITPTESRKNFLSFTRPYLEFPLVVATRQDTLFVEDISSLAGKRVGALEDAAWTESIRANNPEVILVEVADLAEGMRGVVEGDLDAYVDTMAAISYYIGQQSLTDIKIAGKLSDSLPVALGVRKQEPLLAQVFDKAVDSITDEERQDIFRRWITVAFRDKFNYALLWRILAGVAVVMAVIFYWNRKLARLNRAVRRANVKISALLDNSGQGFLSFGPDGVVEPELSRECERLFGKPAAGMPIASLLHPDDAGARETFAKNVQRILKERDGFRRDMYLSLMPRHFVLGDKQVEAELKLLEDRRLMLVLTDVTGQRVLEAKMESERKRLAMIVASVRDQDDFFHVLEDFTGFIRARLHGEAVEGVDGGWDLPSLYRHVHTFKGLLLQLEFIHTPEALHGLETTLAAWQAAGEQADQAKLEAAWEACGCEWALAQDLHVIRETLGDGFFERKNRVLVSVELAKRLERLASRLGTKAGDVCLEPEDARLLGELTRLRHRDLRDMLAAYPKAARMLAERMGKKLEPFAIEGDPVPVDPRPYSPLASSLVHVFRNAVVHGIEEPEQRLEAGKPEAGRISCRVVDLGEMLHIEVRDDGRGIDLAVLRERAEAMGIETTGIAEKDLNLVFKRDLTTQESTDTLSGRGIGLFAVMDRLDRLGGTAEVSTVQGKGTTFAFTVPKITSPPEADQQ